MVTVELAPLIDLHGLVQPGTHTLPDHLWPMTQDYSLKYPGWLDQYLSVLWDYGPTAGFTINHTVEADIKITEPATLSIMVVLVLIITHPGPVARSEHLNTT